MAARKYPSRTRKGNTDRLLFSWGKFLSSDVEPDGLLYDTISESNGIAVYGMYHLLLVKSRNTEGLLKAESLERLASKYLPSVPHDEALNILELVSSQGLLTKTEDGYLVTDFSSHFGKEAEGTKKERETIEGEIDGEEEVEAEAEVEIEEEGLVTNKQECSVICKSVDILSALVCNGEGEVIKSQIWNDEIQNYLADLERRTGQHVEMADLIKDWKKEDFVTFCAGGWVINSKFGG